MDILHKKSFKWITTHKCAIKCMNTYKTKTPTVMCRKIIGVVGLLITKLRKVYCWVCKWIFLISVNIWQHKRMPKNAHGTFTVVILLLSTTNYKHCKRIVGGKHTVIWSKAILKTKKTLQRFLLQTLARASVIPEETDGETKHKYACVCVSELTYLSKCSISEVCHSVVSLQWTQEINHVMCTLRSVLLWNFVGHYVKTLVYLPDKTMQ